MEYHLPSSSPSIHRWHILSVKQFTHRDMYDLFSLAHEMRLQVERNGTLDVLKGKVLCTAFYEPSTRTSSSFDAYRVDYAVLSRAKEDMIVMHPLPRVNEIDPEVDFDSRRLCTSDRCTTAFS
ncbi:hypothetical protein ARMSODRAFT_597972 [Armillaria solidipes]|uniref:Aspartate/ornithine carbamoyltransferase carbamoyl-P binding domain-containing protein n=1 Tax=Armillaria solidipes TaxID=1076256 RepID=A0A2H3BHS5_9AGAR|nr:hypothetical protein ARMSODRAFT_597972 [Armillaria solidipes]